MRRYGVSEARRVVRWVLGEVRCGREEEGGDEGDDAPGLLKLIHHD
jgi:hypothetical protein